MYKTLYKFFVFLIILDTALISCDNKNKKSWSCEVVSKNFNLHYTSIKDSLYSLNLLGSINENKEKLKNCVASQILVSKAYSFLGNKIEAKVNLLSVLNRSPRNVLARFNLARIHLLEGMYDSAIINFKVAAKLKSRNGVIVEITDDARKISESLEYPNFDVEYTEIIYNNAIASFNGRYWLDANYEFQYCISNNKNLKESYFYLGLIQLELLNKDLACKYFEQSSKKGNSSGDSVLKLHCANLPDFFPPESPPPHP
jgi:tetratricopeptide (TPR) repeat protein